MKYWILRGGSWLNYSQLYRVSFRNWLNLEAKNLNVGFRLIKIIKT